MNLRSISIVIVCVIGSFSCGKHSSQPKNMLVGTWSLQQQQVLMYQDSIKITDTTLTAAATIYGTAQFNADGTFNSSSVYDPGNLTLTGPPPSTGKTSGKYSYSGNVFTVNPGLAGWFTFSTGTTGPPTNNSQSNQITQLTASHLTVHAENKFTVGTATGIHSYDIVVDYDYSK